MTNTTKQNYTEGRKSAGPTWGDRFNWDNGLMFFYDEGELNPQAPCSDAEWDAFVDRMRHQFGRYCGLVKVAEWTEAT